MSAEDAARRFAAPRPPIRRGAAFDRPPRDEAEYDDDAGIRSRNARARAQMSDDERHELACYADGWRDFAPGWQRRYEAAQPHNEAVRGRQEAVPRSGGCAWTILPLIALAFLVLGLAIATRAWPDASAGSQPAIPTAIIDRRPAPAQADYGIPAYNATQEAAVPPREGPTATERVRVPPTAAAAQEGAQEGGIAIEAGRVIQSVAPIIRATQTAAPVLSIEMERGGVAIEAGRVARPVVQMGATAVQEGGTAAGAGSFAKKVGKP